LPLSVKITTGIFDHPEREDSVHLRSPQSVVAKCYELRCRGELRIEKKENGADERT